MNDLVDDVKVDVRSVAFAQIVRADYEVTVDFTDTHVTSPSNKFHSQLRKELFSLLTENNSHSFDLLKTLEIVQKRIGYDWNSTSYSYVQLRCHSAWFSMHP